MSDRKSDSTVPMMDAISTFLGTATPVVYPTPVRAPEDLLAPAEDLVDQATKDFRKKAQDNLEADYEEVRSNLKELIADTVNLMPNLVNLVRESESPRMYDSASKFIQMIAKLNEDLLEASATATGAGKGQGGKFFPGMQSGGSVNAVPGQHQTAVFIGTSEDLFSRFGRRDFPGSS